MKQSERRRFLAGVIVWAVAMLSEGCTIARSYSGAPLRADASVLVEGQSTKGEVLRSFGPPTQITHQTDGDAFVYSFDRMNFSSLTLQEPITGLRLFTYQREFNKRDRLVVLFDFGGVVRSVTVEHDTPEMPAL